MTSDPARAEATLSPAAVVAWRDFDDKLGPAKRWLRSRVGRLWDETFAEMKQRFNTRTIAGRHIVHDHMMGWIGLAPGQNGRFTVDETGILREVPRRRSHCRPVARDGRILEAWLAGRRVGRRGSWWFWFVPVEVDSPLPSRWRQHVRLTEEETRRWMSFSDAARCELEMKEGS